MRISRISSVAYATEDIASDEKTARAMIFDSRSWLACAKDIGLPTIHRFSRFAFTVLLGGSVKQRAIVRAIASGSRSGVGVIADARARGRPGSSPTGEGPPGTDASSGPSLGWQYIRPSCALSWPTRVDSDPPASVASS